MESTGQNENKKRSKIFIFWMFIGGVLSLALVYGFAKFYKSYKEAQTVANNEIQNLTVANFASPNISQWTNDANYLTSVGFAQITNGDGVFLDYRPGGVACLQDQVLKYDALMHRWVCAYDAIEQNSQSPPGTETYATQAWVTSQGYMKTFSESDPTLAYWTGANTINRVGTITSGTWNGTPITSTYIADGTIQLSDLAQNSCTDGQVMKWSNTTSAWVCAVDDAVSGTVDWSTITNRPAGLDDGDDDTILTEGQVETYITNGALNLAVGTTLNTQAIATQPWVSSQGYLTSYTETDPTLATWAGSTNITTVGTVIAGTWNGTPITSAYIADGTVQFVDIAQNGCVAGETMKWSGVTNAWQCSPDQVLTEAQVETYITNGSVNLATGSTVNGGLIATQPWVSSQGYLTSYTETDPTLAVWTGSTNIATVGTVTNGTWNGTPITSTYIQNGTIQFADIGQNGCTDGQVMKWNTTASAWQCANDNNDGSSGGTGGTVAGNGELQTIKYNTDFTASSTPADIPTLTITKQLETGRKYRWTFHGVGSKSTANSVWVNITDENGTVLASTIKTVSNTWLDDFSVEYRETGTGGSVTRKIQAYTNGGTFSFTPQTWTGTEMVFSLDDVTQDVTSSIYQKWDPDAPPVTANSNNDEFSDTTLDAAWTVVAGTGTAESDQGLRMTNGNYVKRTLPAGDFSIWTKLSVSGQPQFTNYSQTALTVQQNSGTIWSVGITGINTNAPKIEVIQWSNYLTYGSTPVGISIADTNGYYFSIRRTGTTLSFWVSTDGLTYNRVYTVADPGVNTMGLLNNGSTYAVFDYLRYTNMYKNQYWTPEGRVVDIGTSGLVSGGSGTVEWADILNRPTGLDDGDDTLTEAQVETYATNGSLNLFAGSTVNGATIATQPWVAAQGYLTSYTETDPTLATWIGSTNVTTLGTITSGTWNGTPISSAYIQDATITFADIAQNGCTDGQVMQWNNAATAWQCATVSGGTLTEGQVETYITNGPLDLAAGTTLGGTNIASQTWVAAQGYLTSYIETDPTLATWAGTSNITTVGTVTSGTWNGTPITSAYIADGTIQLSDIGQNGCSDGQVLKWNSGITAWQCANDNNDGGTGGGGASFYEATNNAVTMGGYLEVAHNQATDSIIANAWAYDTATSTWNIVHVSSGGGYLVDSQSFSYRRNIDISNTGALVNMYQVNITLDTSSLVTAQKMKADCSDLRITSNPEGTVLLPFWVESGCNTNATKIWTLVPTIAGSGTTTVYAFYGSSAATSASSHTTVFTDSLTNTAVLGGAWALNETSGTAIADSSGNGITGAAFGSTIVSGKYGKARSFNGTTDYADMSPVYAGTKVGNYSVEFWANIPTLPTKGAFYKMDPSGNGVAVGIGSGSMDATGSTLIILYEGSRWISTGVTLTTGWHHFVLNLSNSGNSTIYMDGAQVFTEAGSAPYAHSGTLRIGGSSGARMFQGTIDEVRYYTNNLPSGDITKLYNNHGYTTSSLPGTILLRQFSSDGSGNEVVTATPGTETAVGSGLSQNYKIVQPNNNTVRVYNYSGATQNMKLVVATSGAPTGGVSAIGDTITNSTQGSIFFAGASSVLSQDNTNLFWDDANNRLGIGTNAPTVALDVNGALRTNNVQFPILGSSPTPVASSSIIYAKSAAGIDDSNTKLLMHMDGADGTNIFTDVSSPTESITAMGNAQIDTAQSQFGGASGYFDGSGDFISIPNSQEFNFYGENFTIDFWARFSANTGYRMIIDRRGTADQTGWIIYLENGDSNIWFRSTAGSGWDRSIDSNVQPALNTWYHIAVVRNGNTTTMYINGTQVGTMDVTNYTFGTVATPMGIGYAGSTASPSGYFSGWLDEVRISKGIARWTTNFTPPTSEYSGVQSRFYWLDEYGNEYALTNPSSSSNNLWWQQLAAGSLSYMGGNIGIGVTNPTHTLSVAGNIGLSTNGYINWGNTDGSTGYGIRDNAGKIEYKDSNGAWRGIDTVPSWSLNPDQPPASPHAQDDEFSDTTIDPKWTIWNQLGGQTVTEQGGVITFDTPSTIQNRAFSALQTPTGATWKYRTKIYLESPTWQYLGYGLVVRNSATNKSVWAGEVWVNSNYGPTFWSQILTGTTTVNSEVDLYNLNTNPMYIEVEYDGTNIIFRASATGVSYKQFYQVNANTALGGVPDQIGLHIHPYGDNNANWGGMVSFDWFRKIQ